MNTTVVEKGAPAVPAAPAGSRLFKAVTLDGFDFHTGTVPWLPPEGAPIPDGGWIVEHPKPGPIGAGSARGYLSTSTVETDCKGFRWPARLLLVEPVGAVWTPSPDSFPRKRAAHAWRACEELPAWQLFGPQGREVAALIEQNAHLTSTQIGGLTAAWSAARDAARVAARHAAWCAALNVARGAALNAARGAACGAALNAARDAALGLLVKDLISVEDFRTLTDPWTQVVGPIEVAA